MRFAEDFPEHAGDERLKLREWLKDRLKAEGHWGAIRATGTTCLDVCAPGRVTIFIDPVGYGGQQRCLVFDPLEDRELIYQTIVRELAPGPHTAAPDAHVAPDAHATADVHPPGAAPAPAAS